MGKVIDITDKLDFEAKPKIIIKDKEIEVNNSAETMLKVMDAISKNGEVEGALAAANLIFEKKEKAKLDKLNLNFSDYIKVIQAAMDLITGDDEGGEQ